MTQTERKEIKKERMEELSKALPWYQRLYKWVLKYIIPFVACALLLFNGLKDVVVEQMEFMNLWNMLSFSMTIDKQLEKK